MARRAREATPGASFDAALQRDANAQSNAQSGDTNAQTAMLLVYQYSQRGRQWPWAQDR
jgi:hypothetical protein